MVRCKVCGYITREGKLKDKCPACGAPRTAFEPYTDTMSPARRRILDLQLHPIATHFPITLVVAVFLFSLAVPFFTAESRELLVDTTKILALLTPVVTAITFAVGWLDGRIRFHKIKISRILKRKVLLAAILLVISLAVTLIVWLTGFDTAAIEIVVILLGAANLVVVFLLGLLGTSINQSAFAGK